MKENDWIIATMNNPEYDNTDFQIVGMNLNNTQLLVCFQEQKCKIFT